MNNYLKFLLLLFFASNCKQAELPSEPEAKSAKEEKVASPSIQTRMSSEFILGTWQNIDNKDINFFLHLNVDEDYVVGEYCSKALNFFFEDCSLEDEGAYCSVRGPLNSLNIEIDMESCINAEIGRGEIQRQDSIIVLSLRKAAGEYGKDHLVPNEVKLKKISDEPFF